MKRVRKTKTRPIRDIGKLYSWYDPLYFVGDAMYRQGVKIGFWTGLITTFEYTKGIWNNPDISLNEAIRGAALAIGIPFVVGVTLTASGLGIKGVPNMIHKGKITLAKANDLGLMEDYKISRLEYYLDTVWDRVFQHEADILFSPETAQTEARYIEGHIEKTREALKSLPNETLEFLRVTKPKHMENLVKAVLFARPYTDGIESTKKAFIKSSMYALTHPIPETEKVEEIGFDLSLLRGWLNGGFFDPGNTRIIEQYSGDPDLREIRREAGQGIFTALTGAPERFWQTICINSVSRALAIKIGTVVDEMNRRYETNEFSSQTFLWPDRENANWLKKYDLAKECVLKYRSEILKSIFGKTFTQADAMLDRLLLPSFDRATALRIAFDPEYCTGELGQNVLSDLKIIDCCEKDYSIYQNLASRSVEGQDNFLKFLYSNEPGLFDSKQKEQLRAVKIAYHIDKDGLQTTYRRNPGCYGKIEREVIKAAANKDSYSRKLRSARLHHELTMIDMRESSDLLKKIAYNE